MKTERYIIRMVYSLPVAMTTHHKGAESELWFERVVEVQHGRRYVVCYLEKHIYTHTYIMIM